MNDMEKARAQFRECLKLKNEAYQLADLAYLNARLACHASVDAAEWWLETEQIRLWMLQKPAQLKDILEILIDVG
jgi:hypothetical protein